MIATTSSCTSRTHYTHNLDNMKPKRKKLKTGLPKGSWSYGDEHPTEEGYKFNGYSTYNGKHIEMWNSEKVRERQRILRNARSRNGTAVLVSGTSLPNGFFKRGDKHPAAAGILFWSYHKGKECWSREKRFSEQLSKAAKSSAERRKLDVDGRGDHPIINQIYALCSRLTKCTGIKFNVDHTVPISKGGTHTPDNLQVVPAFWNMSKSNLHCERWNC